MPFRARDQRSTRGNARKLVMRRGWVGGFTLALNVNAILIYTLILKKVTGVCQRNLPGNPGSSVTFSGFFPSDRHSRRAPTIGISDLRLMISDLNTQMPVLWIQSPLRNHQSEIRDARSVCNPGLEGRF